MQNFSTYDFLTEPIFVTNNKNEICYTNLNFQKQFQNVKKDLNKIIAFFDFDICILDNSKIMEVNPILLGLNSDENYSCFAQNIKDGENYEIHAQNKNNHKIFILKPEGINTQDLDKKIKELETENKKFEELKLKAQSQAVKIGLLNRIYSIIQKENEIENILNLAFCELQNVLGVDKIFFAIKNNNTYTISDIYPDKYFYAKNKILKIENPPQDVYSKINYIKDFDIFETDTKIKSTRIIIPIKESQKELGILCFTLSLKNATLIDEDFLNSLCSQLNAAILQALLLKQLKENQLQLINSEKMATLGNMIAAVAHEINTPLGSINSNNELSSKLIAKELEKDKTNKIYNLLNNSLQCDKEAIKRITLIVQSLKKFIRLDEATMQLTDVNKEMDLTLNLCQHLTKNKITIIKNYKEIPQIYTHPNMLNQVFMNIITNASQSIEKTGTITISTQSDTEGIIISIKDTGCGIPQELQEKIFQQGFTTKEKDKGSGLGLSISKKIIEQLNGKLYFISKEKIGTEFFIKLPL